jgi:hypothetical protein
MIKLRTLAQAFSPRSRAASVCEACGGPFTCGVRLSGCWCAEINLDDDTRAELKRRYSNCLCRQCLEGFAKREVVSSVVDKQS